MSLDVFINGNGKYFFTGSSYGEDQDDLPDYTPFDQADNINQLKFESDGDIEE